jgi:ParB family chromosome partitioning protein
MELREIPLVSIYLPEYIAREKIDDKAIIELAESIKAVGLLEPIVVRPIDGDKFELVAGHRRYLAFKYLQRTTIPAIIQSFDASTAEIAKLSENLIRKDLNPLEEALLIDRIIEKFNLSVNEVAEKLGRSREFVVSRIELLNYPEYVKNAVRDKKISLRVARELMMIDDDEFKPKMYFEYAIVQGINLKTARAIGDKEMKLINQ